MKIPTLITRKKVYQIIRDMHPNRYCIVDCRFDLMDPIKGEDLYRTSHIPTALYVNLDKDLSSPIIETSGRHPLPTKEAFNALLERLGITPKTYVIAYDHNNSLFASRFWWLLKAYGHAQAVILDGGIARYRKGYPLTDEVRDVTPSHYPLNDFIHLKHLTSADVETALKEESITLVDVRSSDRFNGVNETIDSIAGHIPGSENLPMALHLESDGSFRSKRRIEKTFAPLLKKGKPIVFTCGSGVTASQAFFTLSLIGKEKEAAIYPGSWSEWIRNPNRDIAQ